MISFAIAEVFLLGVERKRGGISMGVTTKKKKRVKAQTKGAHSMGRKKSKNKNPKRDWRYYFDDSDYYYEHPVKYRLLQTAGGLAIWLPMLIYYFITIAFDAPENWWTLLGEFGAMIFGIGIFNIIGIALDKYMGHIVTIGCFLVGGGFVFISVIKAF